MTEPYIDPRVSALIVVDMQKGFSHPESRMEKAGIGTANQRAVMPHIKRLLGVVREQEIPVFWSQQVHFPEDIWETGRDEFRIAVSERGGRFLPDASRHPNVVVTAVTSHPASTVAEAAMRAIEAVQNDALGAGIGYPVGLNVEVLDRKPSGASMHYCRD